MDQPHANALHTVIIARADYSAGEVLMYLGIIVVLAVLMGVSALVIKRKLFNAQADDQPPLGFTLKDLRQMHAMGQLSDEELERAESRSLSVTRAMYLGDEQPPGEEVELGDELINPTPDAGSGPENDPQPPDKNGGSGAGS